ncbi:MAG: TPM domain-containing protein, partial [Pseudomonas sp.]|nr:TPM domain-containing protein [Pseudomonas sp.]
MSAWLRLPLALLLVACAALAQAEPNFPALSGRVVDQAGMLDAATSTRLTQELASHEQATGNQLVVVTLPNLQGLPIEDFGYQLGRHWGIGQKGKDNGVLLLIARDERKIRIEVGYGLEGTLTDAQSSLIIQQVISPAFKQGQYSQGISAGVQA